MITADAVLGASLVVTLRLVCRAEACGGLIAAYPMLVAWIPDMVLIDARTVDQSAMYPLRRLRRKLPRCSVLVFGEATAESRLRGTVPLDGFLPVPIDLQKLLQHVGLLIKLDATARRRLRLHRHVRRALEFVAANLESGVARQSIAKAVGVSPSYLAHLFHSESGMTLKRYLTLVRLEVTKFLLAETDDKLEMIARRAGFCGAPHLSRVFRTHTGISAGRYRQARREKLPEIA